MIDLAPHHKRGLTLAHPVMNAAGILGFAGEYRALVDFAHLGAFVTNPLTFSPRAPARGPNAVPLPSGVLIHTGLPNPGVRAAVRRYARGWARLGCPVIIHLAATSPDDVRRSVEILERADSVSGLELGLRDDVSADETAQLIRAAVGGPPLVVRLPLARAAELCTAAIRAGADALTIAAPPRNPSVIPPSPPHVAHETRSGLLAAMGGQRGAEGDAEPAIVTGRLYSPECFPAALEAVRAVVGVTGRLPIPAIGAGGIFSIENARAMLEAGAVAVQVDAAVWRWPAIFDELRNLYGP